MSVSTQIINDVLPKTQSIATSGQLIFDTDWTADATTDILVYARADGVDADDATQLVSSADYSVTFVGGTLTVRVTFSSGRTLDDIITIVRDTPAERMNLFTNTNFTPSMLNEDVGLLVLTDQQAQLYNEEIAPHYNVSATIQDFDLILPILAADQVWAMNDAGDEIIPYDVPAGGGIAPSVATYLLQTSNDDLPNAQVMGELATGFVVNTITTGVQLSRTLTGTGYEIEITNGTGLSGDPVFSIVDNPKLPGTSYFVPPLGTTAQRPVTPTDGMVRYNTTLQALEVYEATEWDPLSGGVVDTVTGTASQIDVDSSDASHPVVSLSATIDTPGTFTIGTTVVLDSIIDDDTFASATATNIPTAESVKAYVDSGAGGTVDTVVGTASQIDVNSADPDNPVVSLSATIDAPGTFTIGTTVVLSAIIDDDTFATATNSNIPTAESVKAYVDSTGSGLVDSVTGTASQVDVNNADAANPIVLLSSTIDTPGTFTIGTSTVTDGIINDSTMATATATNLSTSSAIKSYVDNVAAGGFTVLTSALLATTANLSGTYANGAAGVGATLTNNSTQAALSLDGVVTQVADRVLVKNQTAQEENGIYDVTTVGDGSTDWVLTRASDYDEAAEIEPGQLVAITAGDTLLGSIWLQTATVTTMGTDPIVFSIFAQPGNTFVTLAGPQTITGVKTFGANVNLSSGATLDLNTTTAVSSTLDEDDMTSDSATALATQQSIKAYVDAQTGLDTWSTDASGTIAAAVNNGYICSAGATTATLPATAAIGVIVAIEGLGGSWVLTANTGQTIQIGSSETSTAGTLTSAAATDNVYVTAIVANTTWRVRSTNSAGLTVA